MDMHVQDRLAGRNPVVDAYVEAIGHWYGPRFAEGGMGGEQQKLPHFGQQAKHRRLFFCGSLEE